jgi:hypothetical protein
MSQFTNSKQDVREKFDKLFDLFLNQHTNDQQKLDSAIRLCKFHVNSIDWTRQNLKHFLSYFECELNKPENSRDLNLIISVFSCLDNLVRFVISKQNYPQVHELINSTFTNLIRIFELLNEDTLSETQNRTQFLTQTQLNNNKYASLIKFLPEFLTQFTQLIETLPVELSLEFVLNTGDSLLKIIRLCKDAKTSVLLWKTLSKFLLKYADMLATSKAFKLLDYLKQLYDTIESNLEFLKPNSIFKYDLADGHDDSFQNTQRSSITNELEFVKLIRLSCLFYKMFKGILVKFADTLNDSNREDVLGLCVCLLFEFYYLAHFCPKYLLSLDKKELDAKLQVKNEVHVQFHQVNQVLLTNMDLSFVLQSKRFNDPTTRSSLMTTKYMLFLLNYMKCTNNPLCLYKLFELVDYSKVNFDMPVYFLTYANQLRIEEFSMFLLRNLIDFTAKNMSFKMVNIYLYYLLHGSVRQSLVSLDLLVYLTKSENKPLNFLKYFQSINEHTSNVHLEFLIKSMISAKQSSSIVEDLNRFLNGNYKDTNSLRDLVKKLKDFSKFNTRCPPHRQMKGEILTRLVKVLKTFIINRYLKVDKIEQKGLICEFIGLIYRQLSWIIDDNDNADLQSILFLINFIQQFMIIEPSVNLKYTAGMFLRRIQISTFATMDDNSETLENLNQNLATLFTYLLNSNDSLLVNFTLECLNEFLNLNFMYSDVLCNEIMRSNKRLNDSVGDYLRKQPIVSCTKNDFQILNERLLSRVNAEAEESDAGGCGLFATDLEFNLNGLLDFYVANQKPLDVKNKLLDIVKLINENL